MSVNSVDDFEILSEPEELLPDDIYFLEDRGIGGWVEKRSKYDGYFSA